MYVIVGMVERGNKGGVLKDGGSVVECGKEVRW
jgi:hypothetical protein